LAEIIKQIDDFKHMLNSTNAPYVEIPMGTLIIKNGQQINIRQYHDDFCLSSWTDIEEFKEKVGGLIYGK
jgi:hypothetical protein